jgi:prepilin-type N-terminal cleavage/methylation domain-containing protein
MMIISAAARNPVSRRNRVSWTQTAPLPRRRGFTLLELTVVMTVVSLALALASLILWGGMRMEKVAAGGLQTLGARQALADQFRADVAAAKNAPDRWQDAVAGPACLILQNGDHAVIYSWHDGRLERSERTGDATRSIPVGLGANPTRVEFTRSAEQKRLLVMRLFTVFPDGREDLAAEIMAALGGDSQ